MALVKVHSALQLAVQEVALQTLEEVMVAFREKFDMEEADLLSFSQEMKAKLLEQHKVTAPKKGGKDIAIQTSLPKKKREPSAYNLYLKAKMEQLKADEPGLKGPDLMRRATAAYKEDKAKGNLPELPKATLTTVSESETEASTTDTEATTTAVGKGAKASKGKKTAAA